ncbi:uncharacterized protein LOC126827900 [Patella vulgata]|uniref:uncharacterized protein LOC126827900 n=1 Tax=Patella vulgata TaxID=6465 RepID=UPI0024A99349|nr:uncharacterized protein LOC126827900 [Patella vulgata]
MILGANVNRYSCVRPCIACPCFYQSLAYVSPLAFGVRKDVWIFWNSTLMSAGAALNIGENAFLTYRFANNHPGIQRIFISTHVQTSGIWEMPDYLTFVTKSNLKNTTIYWDVAGVSSALFSIETCGSVDIIFTTNLAHVSYKVGLGDCSNWCTTIQKVLTNNTESTPTTVQVDKNPLWCSRSEDVWISWKNTTNKLEVGTGQVLHQDGIVAMDDMEKDALVERMTIQSSLSAKWKIDVYGCELNRNRTCHCRHPSFHPTLDGDFHCDSEPVQNMEREYDQKMDEPIKSNTWRTEGKLYSTTLAKWIITKSSRIKCGVECELRNSCSIFSYNKLNKSCWLYDAQHFNVNDFIENENFKTYISY